MVEKVRYIPVLHMKCGQLDVKRIEADVSTFFYFLRSGEEGVPSYDSYEDCNNGIAKHVVVGSIKRNFLFSLNRILNEVRIVR